MEKLRLREGNKIDSTDGLKRELKSLHDKLKTITKKWQDKVRRLEDDRVKVVGENKMLKEKVKTLEIEEDRLKEIRKKQDKEIDSLGKDKDKLQDKLRKRSEEGNGRKTSNTKVMLQSDPVMEFSTRR